MARRHIYFRSLLKQSHSHNVIVFVLDVARTLISTNAAHIYFQYLTY